MLQYASIRTDPESCACQLMPIISAGIKRQTAKGWKFKGSLVYTVNSMVAKASWQHCFKICKKIKEFGVLAIINGKKIIKANP